MLFFINAYGINSGKLGSEILKESIEKLQENYPHVFQISDEKIIRVIPTLNGFEITSNKNTYHSKIIVVAVSSSNLFEIDGLLKYAEPHKKSLPKKKIEFN
jgi:thioredoxin reductase